MIGPDLWRQIRMVPHALFAPAKLLTFASSQISLKVVWQPGAGALS